MRRSIPILMYHHVSPDREITPQGFENQLRFLLNQGYRSLSMNEVHDVALRKGAPEMPAFVVTFDDGYLDNWFYAFPILQKLSVKATIYLVTQNVERYPEVRVEKITNTRVRERQPGGFLSWQEIRTMSHSGLVEFGSHTHTHRDWNRRTLYGNIEWELAHSKALIEKETGKLCQHMAWPWGDYNNEWIELLKQLGYVSAVTTMNGANTTGSNPYTFKRIKMSKESIPWLMTRLRWHSNAWIAQSLGFFYGLDRRFKSWMQNESPYAHG